MKFTYKLTQEAFLKAQKLHHQKRNYLLPLIMISTLLAIYFVLSTDFANIKSIMIQLLTVLVMFGLFFYLQNLLTQYLDKKLYEKNPNLSEETTIELSKNAIDIHTKSAKKNIPWDTLSKWVKNEDFYLLYTNVNEFNIIPTHALQEEGTQILQNYLNKHVKQSM